jgi:DNA-binding CsgD family transcriptional regulator
MRVAVQTGLQLKPSPTAAAKVSGTYLASESGRSVTAGAKFDSGSATGFVLVDAGWKPLSFNAEGVGILTYPMEKSERASLSLAELTSLLAEKIRSELLGNGSSGLKASVVEFVSGRRRYVCKTFFVSSSGKFPSQAHRALVLERAPSKMVPLMEIAQQFRLTPREREVLGHLVQGTSSRDIADRMRVSPSTVKAFLRTMMIKMGVCSRSAAVGKALMSVPLRSTNQRGIAARPSEEYSAGLVREE